MVHSLNDTRHLVSTLITGDKPIEDGYLMLMQPLPDFVVAEEHPHHKETSPP